MICTSAPITREDIKQTAAQSWAKNCLYEAVEEEKYTKR